MRLRYLTILLLLATAPAQAATYEMDFTATQFTAGPDVAGSFTYTANAPGGPITAFQSVALTIAGHAYTVGEVGFLDAGANPTGEVGLIGGKINGVNQINGGTTDFMFAYYMDLLAPTRFDYDTGSGLFPTSLQFSRFSVTELQTPLPAALPLFATGLGALGLLGWRRKREQVA